MTSYMYITASLEYKHSAHSITSLKCLTQTRQLMGAQISYCVSILPFVKPTTSIFSASCFEPIKARVIKTIVKELNQHSRIATSKIQSVKEKAL